MKSLQIFLCSAVLMCGSGCGSEDDDRNVDARVTDLFLEDSTINVGDGEVARVDFRFDSNSVFDDENDIVLVVRIPPGLRYREGTAELVTDFGDDKIGARQTNCSDSGESFIEFNMDDNDLDNLADPSGEANGRLKFTVDGVRPVGVDAIGAVANDESVPYGCGELFFPDVEAAVSVQ